MVHLHHPEREVGIAPCADTFLFSIKAMALCPIVGQIAQVGAMGR